MKVRCLMVVNTRTEHAHGSGVTVNLTAHYDPKIPDEVRFALATPNGSVNMYVDNPEAAKEFALGRTFYLDFVPIDGIA